MPIEPQSAQDIFHVDDGVVDHFAQRDNQASQDHRVDRRAPIMQHQRRATNESGIAVRLISAVRQSNRNNTRMTTTKMQPIHMACERLSSDRSMNVAGRKIVGSSVTSASPGRRVFQSRFHLARHFERVAPGLLFDDQQQAGPIVDHGIADRRGKSSTTSATSPSRNGAPVRKSTTAFFRSSAL